MAGGLALIAFFGLTAIHVSAAILYKYSQSDGKYEYSPATTLVLAEVVKIFLSLFLHCTTIWEVDSRSNLFERLYHGFTFATRDAWRQMNARILGQLAALALSYTIYNQCQFLVFMWADAASVVLLRSSGSFVAALMAYFLLQRVIVRLQWLNIALQVFGLILVQYDACRAQTTLPLVLYVILFIHVSLSSFNSIWNEHLVKAKDAPSLNVQNAFLYMFGALFNFMAYLILPSTLYGADASAGSRGFFHGYTFITVLIVVLNSVIGLAITAVYKYADVIVKTFSLACATGTLFLVDYLLFGREIGFNVLAGILIVYGASYLYFCSTPKAAPTLPTPTTTPTMAKLKPKSLHPSGKSRPGSVEDNITGVMSRKSPIPSPSGSSSEIAEIIAHQTKPKRPFHCLLVPEFLINNAPPKSTMLAFFVLYLLLSFYVSTHTGALKPLRSKSPKTMTAPIAPSAATVVPGTKDTPTTVAPGAKLNATQSGPLAAVPIASEEFNTKDLAPNEVIRRPYDKTNRADNIAKYWKGLRKLRPQEGPVHLAVCFIEASSANALKGGLRWNVELSRWADASFDKFAVYTDPDLGKSPEAIEQLQADHKPGYYGGVLDPVAQIHVKTPATREKLAKVAGNDASKLAGFCTLEDFANRIAAASACLDLIDYHSQKEEVEYKYILITEPDVDWTKASLSGNLHTHDPNNLHFRTVPGTNDLFGDPTCLLSAPKNVRSFVKHASKLVDELLSLETTLEPNKPSLQEIVQTAAERSYLSISSVPYFPPRGYLHHCDRPTNI